MNTNEADVAEAIEALQRLQLEFPSDVEAAHGRADRILLKLLKALGMRKVAQLYDSIEKWYA